MTTKSKILLLHQQAEALREQDKLLEALKLYEEVIISYQEEKDYSGIVEALNGRALTYKHLFLLTNDSVFALLSQSDIFTTIKICDNRQLNHLKNQCIFNLAGNEMLFENYSAAVKNFQTALDHYNINDAQKGRYYEHLGEAQYLNGDTKNGLKNMLLGLEKIRENPSQTDPFLINVWESGCLLKLYKLTEDKKYLDNAKKIIDSDPRLIIRKRQMAKLS